MHKPFLVTAALLGAITVALGAFGAHFMKDLLTPQSLATYETAVRYQFYHVFALAITGILYQPFPNNNIVRAGYFFISGIILFCGSLYLLTVSGPGYRWLGAVTPFGGISFITGWLYLVVGIRNNSKTGSGKL